MWVHLFFITNILLQTYVTTFAVNYFLCKVILVWA